MRRFPKPSDSSDFLYLFAYVEEQPTITYIEPTEDVEPRVVVIDLFEADEEER